VLTAQQVGSAVTVDALSAAGPVRALAPTRQLDFNQAGLIIESTQPDDDATETALRTDPRLTDPQKRALLAVYRSYIEANGHGTADDAADI
jgi:hypothetical protein